MTINVILRIEVNIDLARGDCFDRKIVKLTEEAVSLFTVQSLFCLRYTYYLPNR